MPTKQATDHNPGGAYFRLKLHQLLVGGPTRRAVNDAHLIGLQLGMDRVRGDRCGQRCKRALPDL